MGHFCGWRLVNPLDVIEQITYLMFIHDLDDSDNLRAERSGYAGVAVSEYFCR